MAIPTNFSKIFNNLLLLMYLSTISCSIFNISLTNTPTSKETVNNSAEQTKNQTYSLFTNLKLNNYTLTNLNSSLPSILVTALNNGVLLFGCNIIKIQCEADSQGKFSMIGEPISTSTIRICSVDNDKQYIRILGLVNNYQMDGNNLRLKQNNMTLANLIKIQSLGNASMQNITKPNLNVTNNSVQNFFSFLSKVFPKPLASILIDISINPNTLLGLFTQKAQKNNQTQPIKLYYYTKFIIFQGCNKVALMYEFKNAKYSIIGKPGYLSFKICSKDYDKNVIQLFANATKFGENDKIIALAQNNTFLQFRKP